MTSSGTRGPRPMPSTCGGGTWSYQPPKSSQVTKIAVEFHSELCMIAFTIEDTKFCAAPVGRRGLRRLRRMVGLRVLARGDERNVGQVAGLRVGDDLGGGNARGVLQALD